MGLEELVARAARVVSVVPGGRSEAAEMVAKRATGEMEATVVTERLSTELA